MNTTVKPSENLLGMLHSVAVLANSYREAAEQARRSIVALGDEIAALIAALPSEEVQAIGLRARAVLRGIPTVEKPQCLTIESLPSLDEGDFDTRPGATTLYLEAMGDGKDRIFLEIRSNPGKLICAYAYDSLKEEHLMPEWFEPVLGIDRKNGTLHLVKQFYDGKQHRVQPGPDADAIPGTFLGLVRNTLDERARFNRVQ